jgi:hypothetical protein
MAQSELDRLLALYALPPAPLSNEPAQARTLTGEAVQHRAAPITATDIMAQRYGLGVEPPPLTNYVADPGNELGLAGTTGDVLGAMDRMYAGAPGAMRSGADAVRRNLTPDNIIADGIDTAANWIDGSPRVGVDTLAPLGLGALAMPFAVPGAVGIFGGRLARTADHEALRRAEEMSLAGRPREDIWNETGWFRGPDGQWRFEIDDSRTAFNDAGMVPKDYRILGDHITALTGDVGSALPHPALNAAYPEVPGVSVVQGRSSGEFRGQYSGGFGDSRLPPSIALDLDQLPDAAARRSTLLHEIQHAVQDLEGFSPGANRRYAPRDIPNPDVARYDLALRENPVMQEYQRLRGSDEYARELAEQNARWNEVYEPRMRELMALPRAEYNAQGRDAIDELFARSRADFAGRYPTMERTDALYAQMREAGVPVIRPQPFLEPQEVYFRAPGEVEARNVQTRAGMSPEERRASPPWTTQDVPDVDQILRTLPGREPQMSVGTKGGGRGRGAGEWRPIADAPAEEMVQARVRYRPEPHPEPWNDGTHIIGTQRKPDGTWVDRQGHQVWPIEWRPFKP